MSYSFADSLLASCQQTCMTYTIAVCTVKTPDDGQRNCPKHVDFHSKNKFEKLVHLIGFILRILKRCTVTWTYNTPSFYIQANIPSSVVMHVSTQVLVIITNRSRSCQNHFCSVSVAGRSSWGVCRHYRRLLLCSRSVQFTALVTNELSFQNCTCYCR
jgi:hypothetical protein